MWNWLWSKAVKKLHWVALVMSTILVVVGALIGWKIFAVGLIIFFVWCLLAAIENICKQ